MKEYHWKGVYGVLITRSDGSTFLASGDGSSVWWSFDRDRAVNFCRDLAANSVPGGVPVQMEVSFKQTHNPSRRGL